MNTRRTLRTAFAFTALSAAGIACAPQEAPASHKLYVFYADGEHKMPAANNICGNVTPPAFTCNYAPLEDCKQQINGYLTSWLGDFDIDVVTERPEKGSFYTTVVTSGDGGWCGASSKVAGSAPFLCRDLKGGVAYAFLNGQGAKRSAVAVAQETSHMIGLTHTDDPLDIMNPSLCVDCDGYPDRANATVSDPCDRGTQNSYQMMMNALGPRKPAMP